MVDMETIQIFRGYRFVPEPEECIDFLTDKVVGNPFPCDIFEFNPYDIKQLPHIFSAAEKKDVYFFTKLSRKGKGKGKTNINRTVGKGSWHNDQNKDLFDPENPSSVIGTARTFTYWETGSIYNRCFIMTEYQLSTNGLLQYDPLKDPVLCRLRCNVGKKPRRVTRNSTPLQVQSALHDDPPASSNFPILADFPTNTVSDNSASSFQVEPSIPSVYVLPQVSSVASESQSRQTLAAPQDDLDTLMAIDFDNLEDDIDFDSVLDFLNCEEQGNDQLLLPPTCCAT